MKQENLCLKEENLSLKEESLSLNKTGEPMSEGGCFIKTKVLLLQT
jgi:hypothetical protein